MLGFAILAGFQLLGMGLHALGVPLPASVIGLALFTASLFAGWVKLEWVEAPSALLLGNMLLFFVPVVMGLSRPSPVLRLYWIPIAVSLVVSLAAVMLSTGVIFQALLGRRKESL